MTATRAQKIRLGVFTITALAALALVLAVFAGLRFWERHDRYIIYFADSVIGLEDGAVVYFGGIKIGTVDKIEVAPDDLRKIKVTIKVKRGGAIRVDTTATLRYAGITGLKEIDLQGGALSAPRLASGGTIAVGVTALDRLERQADELVDQSRAIMTAANRVVTNLATVTDPAQFAGIREMVADARTTSANLAAASGGLLAMVTSSQAPVRRTLAAVDQVAGKTAALLDGDGARLLAGAGRFVDDLRGMVRDNGAVLRTSMFDLRQASRSFKDLARDLRQRPSRLFFSQSAQERKLP